MDAVAQAWDRVRELCRRVERDITLYEEQRDPQTLDSLVMQVDLLLQHLHRLGVEEEVVQDTSQALALLSQQGEVVELLGSWQIDYTGRRGRPRYNISQQQLEHLLNLNFDCPTIAKMLGVSLSTVRRRMAEYHLSVNSCYSTMNDDELDGIVREIKVQFPNSGYRIMDGLLHQRGMRIQQSRIREAMQRTDPNGTVVRFAELVHRRSYHVPGPQSLWHIDGNHKLIRWRIVVHGGIDGFSRLIVFLDCATNNTATTVFRRFHTAVQKYGLPSRIRSDKGGENTQVALYILEHPLRGPGRGSMIVGRSVHNQRIERLWRDVFQGVLKLYYGLFYHLESTGALDPDNDVHLFCLHYVYVPRISRHLDEWMDAWNMHPLRTEQNHTPLQLWTRGLLSRSLDGALHTAHINDELMDEVNINGAYLQIITVICLQALFSTYGVDWDGPPPSDGDDSNMVVVPVTACPLSQRDMEELQSLYNPLTSSDDFAVDVYVNVLEFTVSKLTLTP